jgi:two-component system OmpR family response regulator
MWRCLIVEDDAVNADYIAQGLREGGHHVTVCADPAAALELATGRPWDVMVLDRMLPGDVDGLSILGALRAAGLETPVIVLSALAALDERVKGLKAGGDDYLAKPFALPELTARIEALIRRAQSPAAPSRLAISDLHVDLLNHRVQRGGRTIALQPREFRLLAYMMANPRQVLTRTMLLEAVWNYRFDPQTNVIDVHISRLRQKIDGGGVPPLIHTVRGVGYVLAEDGAAAAKAGASAAN